MLLSLVAAGGQDEEDERHVIFDCPACSLIRSRFTNVSQPSIIVYYHSMY